ncbi:class I adenylate-forming enzyme family protein [Rhodococcus oxybenzonivorans]|uniref:class I adenylate-forming enzyme family protein n=1 Tax=Rhodococcus oxybenzonivorans TaxID=1990687 RepID=UPI002953FB12|nr:class I adenylate-forming enzyme family protein [Rhodococcus oxybenzonivorans]MDV7352735.1 class I adenylate-forming enzyme family protein [Rhodococcus oxybenzonivorans]
MTALGTTPPLRAEEFESTAALLAAAARVHGDRDAYVEPGGGRISFADWASRAHSLAAHLYGRGIGKGDVVALILPSGIDYAVCLAAVAMLGGVTTGVNPRLGPRETEAIFAQSRPALVIRDPDANLPEAPAGYPTMTRADVTAAVAEIERAPSVAITRSDPVTIVFTSGTTGLPKGAWFDADNLAASAAASGIMSAPYDRRLTGTPFSHAGYMSKLWDQLVWGTALIEAPSPWSAAGMYAVIRDERITVGGGVPTQWEKLLELPDLDPSAFAHLRVGVVASAPASPALISRVRDLIGVPLVVRYAMTESPTVCGTEPDDAVDVQFRTVGRPQYGMKVRITDADGRDVSAGEVGRIRIRGGCVTRGYWNNKALTAESFDQDGYFVSSDLGYFTDEGNLVLAGRVGDMYIRGGFNVHPVEVEHAIGEHPDVLHAAVVGHPAPVIGEMGVAFVVPEDPARPPTLEDLRTWSRARLADYKAPDYLIVVETIPLNAMAKTDRAALHSLAQEHLSRNPVVRQRRT